MREKIDFILSKLLIVFFFFILIIYASREISDLDLWLHIKTGKFIVTHRLIPHQDIFSFTIQGKPWINHEWLFQVIAYNFHKIGGFDGLILMQNLVVIGLFFLIFLSYKKTLNYVLIFIILYMVLLSTAYRFTIRPDIFSMLFFTAYLFILKKFSSGHRLLIYSLPILQALWTNIHGFSFIGPLLILIFILSEAIKRSIKLPYQWNIEGKLQDRSLKDLVIVFFISIAATFLNPYGIEGASYPLTVLAQITGKGKIVFKYIQELARPITLKNIFNPNVFIFYKSFILISLFSFRFNQKNINVSNLILWLCFTVFSFFAIRNIAYFGIVAGFVCLENVESAIRNHKKLPFPLENPRFKMYSVYLFMAILFIYTGKGAFKYLESYTYIFDTYSLKSGMWGLTENKFPEKAVNFLLNCNIKGNMINDFNSGSYLIGRTYPMRQVFIDGRTELYGPVFFSDYVRLGEGERGIIEKTVAKYDIRGFFLTVSTDDLHTGLMRYLSKNPLWKVVYFDQTAIIFLKDIPENSKIIREFSIDLKRWKPAKPDLMKLGIVYRYPYPYVQRGRFLWRLGFFEAAAREAVEILAISPVNPDAYKFLSDYFYSKGNYNKAFQYARNCLVLASGDSYTRTRLALIYHKLGKDENALKVINAIIKNRPNYPEAFFVKAQIVKDKDINSAIEFLKTAIKFDGKEARYHNELGNLYEKKGEMEKAGEEWKRSFEYGGSRRDFKNN